MPGGLPSAIFSPEKPVKLLLSAFACDPSRGGEFQTGWRWALGNACHGNEVWCLTTEAHRPVIEAHADQVPANLRFVYVSAPARIERFYLHPLWGYIHYVVWQRTALQVARQLDRETGFDLVHHVTYGSLQLGTAMWQLGKPLVFGPAGGGQRVPRQLRKYYGRHWITEAGRSGVSSLLSMVSPYFRQTMRRARLVLAVNGETRELAHAAGAPLVRLMPDTGLGDDFFPGEMPVHREGQALKLLWLGRVLPRKGLPLALDALGTVRSEIPFSLTIIGDGVMGSKIPSWIAMNDLQDVVEWRGKVPWTEIRAALASHDVLFFPTLRDSCPSQFLEAMAFGLPVVCLDIHGARDFVPSDAGIKVPVGRTAKDTALALGRAVADLAGSRDRYTAMSRAAAQYARTQSWSLRIERMNEIYGELLAE